MFNIPDRFVLLATVAALGAPLQPASADFVASGSFKYEDREFDKWGWTGNWPLKPIRLADVEIREMPGGAVLASTTTDMNGSFHVLVPATAPLNVQVVCLARSDQTLVPFWVYEGLNNTPIASVSSPVFTAVNPTGSLTAGTTTALRQEFVSGNTTYLHNPLRYNRILWMRT